MYNASKAAVHLYSDTLRLELAPFSVKVVTVVTGAVATSFKANVPVPNLPANSLYLPVKANIEAISRGEKLKNPQPSDAYAEEVVKDVLGGKTGKTWRGTDAVTGRIAKLLFPGWLIVSLSGHVGMCRYVMANFVTGSDNDGWGRFRHLEDREEIGSRWRNGSVNVEAVWEEIYCTVMLIIVAAKAIFSASESLTRPRHETRFPQHCATKCTVKAARLQDPVRDNRR